MGQKELSMLLKVVVVVLAVFLAAVLIFFVPMLGRSVSEYYAGAGDAVKTVIFGWVVPGIVAVSSVPGFISLWLAWGIFTEIGRNNSFCAGNARRLRTISRLALGDTCVYVILAVSVLALGPKHPSVPLIFVSVTLFGAAVTICCAALSHLTQKAADLKDDNDLTI